MKSIIKSILCGTALILMASCASSSSSKQAPSGAPSATISVGGMTAAYKGAVASAKGTLNYQGQIHHFTMTGVGYGGYGAQKVAATGEVYNLNSLADFAGIYTSKSKGVTLGNGKMQSKASNQNGVVVYLTGERQGLATNSGVRTFKVKLID